MPGAGDILVKTTILAKTSGHFLVFYIKKEHSNLPLSLPGLSILFRGNGEEIFCKAISITVNCWFLARYVKEHVNKREQIQGSYPVQKQISRTFPGLRLIFPGLYNSH